MASLRRAVTLSQRKCGIPKTKDEGKVERNGRWWWLQWRQILVKQELDVTVVGTVGITTKETHLQVKSRKLKVEKDWYFATVVSVSHGLFEYRTPHLKTHITCDVNYKKYKHFHTWYSVFVFQCCLPQVLLMHPLHSAVKLVMIYCPQDRLLQSSLLHKIPLALEKHISALTMETTKDIRNVQFKRWRIR